jgi:small subunit ribosomal protein S17
VSTTTRNDRKERQGVVVSDVQDKTIVVRIQRTTTHPLYGKTLRVSKKYHVHDEANEAKVGDTVRIIETRPLSKLKRWRLAEIVERAK